MVDLGRGALSLGSTIEELLGRNSSGSGLENQEYGRGGSVALTTRHPLSAKVDTNFGRSVGIVFLRTETTEVFSFFLSFFFFFFFFFSFLFFSSWSTSCVLILLRPPKDEYFPGSSFDQTLLFLVPFALVLPPASV
jgi:hypothetical protein